MIKSELIQKIAEENPHLFQRDVERIVGTVFDEIIEAMAAGHRVELRGFGAFSVKKRDARQGRNPRTGDAVTVDALARLQLAACRRGCRVVLRNASEPLLELVELMGLSNVLSERRSPAAGRTVGRASRPRGRR